MGSKLWLFLLSALAACLLAGPAGAAPRSFPGQPYTVTDLKPLDGSLAFALDVNLAGQATGVMTMETSGGTFFRGFFFDPQTGLVDIGTLPGGENTFPQAINDQGLVTGSSQAAGGKSHAFIYTPGVGMKDLGAGPAEQSFGNDIDESGHVIGSLFPGDHAFFWDGNTINDVGPGSIQAFNFAGEAFGYRVENAQAIPGMWNPQFTAFTPFPPVPSPYSNGYVFSGNIFGEAVGELSGNDDETAFLWNGRSYSSLEPTGFASSVAESINNAGNVVVRAFNGTEDDVPFLFRLTNSDPLNGNTLNPSGSPFSSFLEFTSIDDIGHIAGGGRVGNEVHGFVLTPSFPTELDTVGLILEGKIAPANPFWKYIETMRQLGLVARVNSTSCYEFRKLRQSLSVSRGVPFSSPQRLVSLAGLRATLEQNKCTNALPRAPMTVPHIFAKRIEEDLVALQAQATTKLIMTTTFPRGALMDVPIPSIFETAGKRSAASAGSAAKRVKLKITKTRTKTSVTVKVSGLKPGTLHFAVVAKKLLNGKPIPVTTKVAK